jgi:hypothetical protein
MPNLLYADDLTLLAENEADMNALLSALELFCHLMRMVVNLAKPMGLVFGPRGIPRHPCSCTRAGASG